MNNANCYNCKYRRNVSGDAHSCCVYPGNSVDMFDMFNENNRKNIAKLNIKASRNGVSNGWFCWPINFDPVWLTNCDGFKEKDE